MTDNRTNARIIHDLLWGRKLIEPGMAVLLANDAHAIANDVLSALNDAGRLIGEPTEAQVEAAAKAIADCHNPGMFEKYPENWMVEARAALVAAARVGKEKNE